LHRTRCWKGKVCNLWTGKHDLPPEGMRISVRSIQVKNGNGDELGSAIFSSAERASGKDSGYYKELSANLWMFPKDHSVADQTRSLLADADRALLQ
jgi:hypothetical protein